MTDEELKNASIETLRRLLKEGTAAVAVLPWKIGESQSGSYGVYCVEVVPPFPRVVDITANVRRALDLKGEDTPNRFTLNPGRVGFACETYLADKLTELLGYQVRAYRI